MPTLQSPLTIKEILSKAPGNPVLWQLFLAELAGAMQCDSGFLSIADLGGGGEVHHLCLHNVVPGQRRCFERQFPKDGSFDASVVSQPRRVFCFNMPTETVRSDGIGIAPGSAGELSRFSVSLPLNSRYTYFLSLNVSRPFAGGEWQNRAHRLQALVPLLQNALQKEQWLSLYRQITLLTGKHVATYIIVDPALNVIFFEPAFNRIIADLKCVEIRGRRLVFLNKTSERHVLAMMEGIGCEALSTHSQCASCAMTLIPARHLDNFYAWEFYKKGVVLVFTGGYENSPALLRLMALHNLTKCEALCALQFIATPSIPDIATGSHRSTETVRNHIKSIMQKLGVHNQGALMKKLLAIAAL